MDFENYWIYYKKLEELQKFKYARARLEIPIYPVDEYHIEKDSSTNGVEIIKIYHDE